MANTLRVHETFWSIQGEGTHAGRTAYFIRLQGCPVGCVWCDSKLTWYAGGENVSIDTIYEQVSAHPSALVIITGGEPLLHDLDPLLTALHGYEVHIETSGALIPKGRRWRSTYLVVSPKHAADWQVQPSILAHADELKYVVDEAFDPAVVATHRKHTRWNIPVVLMPEGSPPRPEMVERTLELLAAEPSWRFGPRLQYAYQTIAAREGRNNHIISADDARAVARQRVRS